MQMKHISINPCTAFTQSAADTNTYIYTQTTADNGTVAQPSTFKLYLTVAIKTLFGFLRTLGSEVLCLKQCALESNNDPKEANVLMMIICSYHWESLLLTSQRTLREMLISGVFSKLYTKKPIPIDHMTYSPCAWSKPWKRRQKHTLRYTAILTVTICYLSFK